MTVWPVVDASPQQRVSSSLNRARRSCTMSYRKTSGFNRQVIDKGGNSLDKGRTRK